MILGDESQQSPNYLTLKNNRNTLRVRMGDPGFPPPQLLREAVPTPPLVLAGGGDIDRKVPTVGPLSVVPELDSGGYPKVEENPSPWNAYPDDRPRLLVGERLRALRRKGSVGCVRFAGNRCVPVGDPSVMRVYLAALVPQSLYTSIRSRSASFRS